MCPSALYTPCVMSTCRICQATLRPFNEAAPEQWTGNDVATCTRCAAAASAEMRRIPRVHWRDKLARATLDRVDVPRSRELPPGTTEACWAFCDACSGYLSARGFARFKDRRGSIKWMAPVEDTPPPGDLCQACMRRPATVSAFVRLAQPR